MYIFAIWTVSNIFFLFPTTDTNELFHAGTDRLVPVDAPESSLCGYYRNGDLENNPNAEEIRALSSLNVDGDGCRWIAKEILRGCSTLDACELRHSAYLWDGPCKTEVA